MGVQAREIWHTGPAKHFSQSGAACEQAEAEAVHLASEMQAEYWSVSAKTGESVLGASLWLGRWSMALQCIVLGSLPPRAPAHAASRVGVWEWSSRSLKAEACPPAPCKELAE